MESNWILITLLSALALSVISNIIKHQRRSEKKLPPGPKPWPIIGNLNLLGPIPHQSLHLLSRKYGEIMLLHFGKLPAVIASSPEMAEQFLKVHDAAFASRPKLAAGKHISYNYSDVAFAPYGPYWRKTRKIFVTQFLNAKNLESLEQIRVEEGRSFLSYLRLESDKHKPVVLRNHLSRFTLSLLFRMVLTEKYFEEESVLDMHGVQEMINEWFVLTGAFNIGDWIPWLGFLDLQGYVKRMKGLRKKMDRFYDYVIDDHLAKRSKRNDGGGGGDFVDVLLKIAEDPNAEVELSRDCIKALIMNMLLGGTESTSTAVEWAIHELLRQPRIIEKAKAELDTVIGRERWVEENDFSHLPYLEAIIVETFRLHPLATLLAPRYAMEDCNVAGYHISKGTTVFINAWSLGRNADSWEAAEEFSPERFLGKQIEITGGNFALLPFSSGRRRCPGYNLGLKIVRTTLANLLHGFELKLEEGMKPQDVSMEESYGLTTNPKYPLSIIIKPTLPDHLY